MSNELYHKTWEDLYYDSEVKNNKLQKKVEILTKACEFYGENMEDVVDGYLPDACDSDEEKWYKDLKTVARQALKECKELG